MINLFANPMLLLTAQENIPEALYTFTHCSVEVRLEKLVVMVIESLLLLRGNPLYFHSTEG